MELSLGYYYINSGLKIDSQVVLDDERLIVDISADGRVVGIESLSGDITFKDLILLIKELRYLWKERDTYGAGR